MADTGLICKPLIRYRVSYGNDFKTIVEGASEAIFLYLYRLFTNHDLKFCGFCIFAEKAWKTVSDLRVGSPKI